MTTYNGERFIEEQLRSIKNQTLLADEVVIFDDCSSDRTVEIVEAFIKEYRLNWTICANKCNVGYIENFYKAIEATTGDIIFLCDQDDIWHLDKIEKMVYLFQKQKSIHTLCTGFRKIDEHSNPEIAKQKPGYTNYGMIKGCMPQQGLKKIALKYILQANISPGCTLAFTKTCKEIYITNASKLWCHDWELCIFGGMIDGLFFYNEELTDYRLHASNTIGLKDTLTGSFKNEKEHSRIELAQMEFERIQLYITSALVDLMEETDKKTTYRYLRFTNKRAEALKNKRIGAWLQCIGYFATYIRAVRIRGVAGDFLYILLNKRKQEVING
jgi:glycosyltransferase involved in cell wall biosynthesis